MTGLRWVPTEDGELLWTATGGEGPPLVLCHGGPGLWDDQGPVARMVEDLVTVHRYDQRGCGRSSASGPYTVARFVADLEALREHFGRETWMVGRHSWGATLALRYAIAHPERVRALLYVSGTGAGHGWNPAYRAALPRAELRLLEGVGHIPWVEDPEGFRSVVRGFLLERAQHLYRKLGYEDSGCLLMPEEALEILFSKRLD